MTMTQFLNKHANGEHTVLGYWFEDSDLEGRTDYEILRKCFWLDMNKQDALNAIFSQEKIDEFIEDYTNLSIELKIDTKKILMEVRINDN